MKWKEDDSVQKGNNPVIRQAISCDICGAEMQHTNHWFVAYDQGAELRLSGWSNGRRLRAGVKHLCGQTCLHKLVDEFMASTASLRGQAVVNQNPAAKQKIPLARAPRMDASLTSAVPHAAASRPEGEPAPDPVLDLVPDLVMDEYESSARLIPSCDADAIEGAPYPAQAPAGTARNWQAEAWKRERERALRGDARPTVLTVHRRNIA